MTRVLPILLVSLGLGCASGKKAEKSAEPPKTKPVATARVIESTLPQTRILPLNARVASVNDKLRFVVIDFTNTRRPDLEQRLSVYRVGQKVAEIKVSGPYRNATVAADLVAGEARYGDEVRSE